MQSGKVAQRLLSWRVVAAILAGMLAGSIIMTPVGAHVTTSVKHLINKHIKKQFYTKKQSNSRFVLKTDSTALAGFKNGPGDVPSVPTVTQAEATIGTLAVPAGNFAIFAKLALEDTSFDETPLVTCRMEAGADVDEGKALLFAAGPGALDNEMISLQVVHVFPSAGSVVVKCKDSIDPSGPNATSTKFTFLKITAIEQGSISNVALP